MTWSLRVAAQSPPQPSSRILWILAAVVALATLIAVVAWIIRRLTIGSSDTDPFANGFSLSDIRRLHRDGHLSDEEFDSAKRLLVAKGRSLIDAEGVAENKNLAADSDKMSDEGPTSAEP